MPLAGGACSNFKSFYFKILSNATGMNLVVDPTPTSIEPSHDRPDRRRHSAGSSRIGAERQAYLRPRRSARSEMFYDIEFVEPDRYRHRAQRHHRRRIPIQETQHGTYRIPHRIPPDMSQRPASWQLGPQAYFPTAGGPRTVRGACRSRASHSSLSTPNGAGPHRLQPLRCPRTTALEGRRAADRFLPGATVGLEARLTDHGWPMPESQVNVLVIGPDGASQAVTLHDDGNHGDATSGDAVWTNSFASTAKAGVYEFLFRSTGRNERGELRRARRAATSPSPRWSRRPRTIQAIQEPAAAPRSHPTSSAATICARGGRVST